MSERDMQMKLSTEREFTNNSTISKKYMSIQKSTEIATMFGIGKTKPIASNLISLAREVIEEISTSLDQLTSSKSISFHEAALLCIFLVSHGYQMSRPKDFDRKAIELFVRDIISDLPKTIAKSPYKKLGNTEITIHNKLAELFHTRGPIYHESMINDIIDAQNSKHLEHYIILSKTINIFKRNANITENIDILFGVSIMNQYQKICNRCRFI